MSGGALASPKPARMLTYCSVPASGFKICSRLSGHTEHHPSVLDALLQGSIAYDTVRELGKYPVFSMV